MLQIKILISWIRGKRLSIKLPIMFDDGHGITRLLIASSMLESYNIMCRKVNTYNKVVWRSKYMIIVYDCLAVQSLFIEILGIKKKLSKMGLLGLYA